MVEPDAMERGGGRAAWALPEEYDKMSPGEQGETLRDCIMQFLRLNGPAQAALVAKEVGANADSVRRVLEYLGATQHIYVEIWGPHTKLYFSNGKLAHDLLQGEVHCGRTQYLIRTYDDRLTGRNITVTEYRTLPTGQRVARGGIRVDLVDLPVLLKELQRIEEVLGKEPSVFRQGLVTGN